MCARTCCTLVTLRSHLRHHTFLQNLPATFLTCCEAPSGLRGTQRTLTGRPTAGAQVLARVPKAPWHPHHSWPALHCRVPCSPFVLAFLEKHRVQAFRSLLFGLYLLSTGVVVLSCLATLGQHEENVLRETHAVPNATERRKVRAKANVRKIPKGTPVHLVKRNSVRVKSI